MATIQIREIPEDAYEVIRKRTRADGRSIQSYMRLAGALRLVDEDVAAHALRTRARGFFVGRAAAALARWMVR